MTHPPGREPLLHWCRGWLPDLRIGYALVGGKRQAFARFTWGGEAVELEASGDDDTAIVLEVANGLREQLRLPPLGTPPRRTADEQAITMAALRGDTAAVDAMTHDLVAANASTRPPAAPTWVRKAAHDAPRTTRFQRW